MKSSTVEPYCPTMRQRQRLIKRRILIGVSCILLIFYSTGNLFFDRRHVKITSKNSHKLRHQSCRIWPSWNASDSASLRYDHYIANQAHQLSVGDAKIWGNWDVCLKATSRLDAYHTP